jgi:DNA-binding transcriptional LysR family regulator
MEDRDWLILQELYRTKNITKASQKLYMSQPALTARLQNIESEFNVKIVTRSTKGIKFTPEGEYLVAKADDMLEELHKIKNQIQELHNEIAGTINIGASNYLTLHTLPGLLEKFQKLHPAVKYTVATDWSKEISLGVCHKKYHLGFVSVDYGYTKKIKMYDEPICVAYRDEIKLEDLPKLSRIDYQSDPLLRAQIEKWWGEHFEEPSHINMDVERLESCKHMIKHGLGYSIIPYQMVAEDKDIHTTLLRDAKKHILTRTSWLLYIDETAQIPTVKAFIDFIKKYPFFEIKGEDR